MGRVKKTPKRRICELEKQLIFDGVSLKTAAAHCGIEWRTAYRLAEKNGWPLNPACPEGGQFERNVLNAYQAGYTTDEVATLYRLSKVYLCKILGRIAERIRNEKGMDVGDRHQGEGTPTLPGSSGSPGRQDSSSPEEGGDSEIIYREGTPEDGGLPASGAPGPGSGREEGVVEGGGPELPERGQGPVPEESGADEG